MKKLIAMGVVETTNYNASHSYRKATIFAKDNFKSTAVSELFARLQDSWTLGGGRICPGSGSTLTLLILSLPLFLSL